MHRAALVVVVVASGCAAVGAEVGREWDAGVVRAARSFSEFYVDTAPPEPWELRRRALTLDTRWGKEGVWVAAAVDVFASSVDVAALPGDTPLTVWTLGDGLVAAELGTQMAVPAVGDDGVVGFFDDDGGPLAPRFVRGPLTSWSVSSGFGKRTSPFTGQAEYHSGVDLAGDRGDAVVSVGDGVVVAVGENAVAGRFVRVRHDAERETSYGHLDRFVKGLHVGQRVKAGERIGNVGATGRATGPHLHFEVFRDGVRIDPRSVRWKTKKKLPSTSLAAHQQLAAQLQAMTTEQTLTASEWPPASAPGRAGGAGVVAEASTSPGAGAPPSHAARRGFP